MQAQRAVLGDTAKNRGSPRRFPPASATFRRWWPAKRAGFRAPPGPTAWSFNPTPVSGVSCRTTMPTVNSDAVPLKRAGLKATSPRMYVLEAFRNSDRRHLSAEDVYRILLELDIDAGLSTVYRVLNQLVQANILLRHSFESDHAVFELNEGGHHDHLICVSCGLVEEFKDEGIELRQRQVAAQNDFVLREHMLVLYGLCPACQESGVESAANVFHK